MGNIGVSRRDSAADQNAILLQCPVIINTRYRGYDKEYCNSQDHKHCPPYPFLAGRQLVGLVFEKRPVALVSNEESA